MHGELGLISRAPLFHMPLHFGQMIDVVEMSAGLAYIVDCHAPVRCLNKVFPTTFITAYVLLMHAIEGAGSSWFRVFTLATNISQQALLATLHISAWLLSKDWQRLSQYWTSADCDKL